MDQTVQSEAVSIAELWWGILIGPAAWALDQGISYAIDQHACSTGKHYELHLLTVFFLCLAVSGLWAGYRQLRRIPPDPNRNGLPLIRSWFMAWLGILMSLEFGVVIVAMAIPKIVLSPCD